MAHLAFKASRAVQPTAWKVRLLRRLVGIWDAPPLTFTQETLTGPRGGSSFVFVRGGTSYGLRRS